MTADVRTMKYLEIAGRATAWIFRLCLLLICFAKMYYADYLAAILFIFAFGLSILPVLLNQVFSTRLPWILDLLVSYMLLAHMSGFLVLYDVWPFWDDIGHIIGSASITLIGFFLAYAYNSSGKIKITNGIIVLFAIMWTMSLGAFWEIIEFIWDFIVSASGIVTATGQYGFAQNGLFDTMIDLTIDLVSALTTSTLCLFFVRHAKKTTVDSIVKPIMRIIGNNNEKIMQA